MGLPCLTLVYFYKQMNQFYIGLAGLSITACRQVERAYEGVFGQSSAIVIYIILIWAG